MTEIVFSIAYAEGIRDRPIPAPVIMARRLLLAGIAGLCLTLAGCQSVPAQNDRPSAVQRILVTKDQVAEAIEHEKAFAQYYDVTAPAGENWFAIDVGPAPLLVVAAHATAQTREGARKPADRGTGALAVMLHKLAGATAMYTVYESPSDPNYYDDNAFKETLSKLLQELQPAFVLDLHTSRSDRPYAVDFGTMEGKSLLDRPELLASLEEALRKAGVQDLSTGYFSAERHHTITKWVSQRGVPAIQLEINAGWLVRAADQPADHRRFEQLLQGLVNFLQGVAPAEAATEPPFPSPPAAP